MTEEINETIFNQLVRLAALELSEAEAAYLRRELNNQLTAIHTLESIDIPDEVIPAARGVPYPGAVRQPPREDEIVPCEDVDAILALAPALEADHLQVPDIPHEELE